MTQHVDVHGTVAPEFTDVREAFVENFCVHDEIGAAVAVVRDGELVVDLWGGYADADGNAEWQRDTLVNVFSTTKGMVALCAHLLIDRGLLDIDAPVAHYWPEFAQHGKGGIPVRYVLDHRAGLPWLSPGPDQRRWFDWDACCERLARYDPQFEPGTEAMYHAVTFGFLVGEVIRRISGHTVGEFFALEIAAPLAVDFHIGLPDEDQGRVAEIVAPAGLVHNLGLPEGSLDLVMLANSPEWRRAEIPSMNGHGTARSVAQVYGVLANGGRVDTVQLVSRHAVELMSRRSGITDCGGGPHDPAWALGFMPNWSNLWGPHDSTFGHTGFGGSFGCADPEARVSIAYVMNRMGDDWSNDPRADNLITATYSSL